MDEGLSEKKNPLKCVFEGVGVGVTKVHAKLIS